MAATDLWHFNPCPVSDEATSKRLAAADPSPMAGFFADLTALLVGRLAPHADRPLAPVAAEVLAIDQTTLDPVTRTLPTLRGVPPGDDRLLPGKLAGDFDVRRQSWRRIEHLPGPRQNEKRACRNLVAGLPRHSLLLVDLGYFAFARFADLTAGGLLWVSRLLEKGSYDRRHVLYEDCETLDALVWLGAHRADRAKDAVRLVQFRRSPARHRDLTNVLCPRRLPLAEVAVNTAKTDLGLHLM